MEIQATVLEKKNATDLALSDYLIIAGCICLVAGGLTAGLVVLS
jgi:hypothetical protein